ncbi:hypothetical protein ACIBSR_38735 [Streptomyces sp. NPDC049936]|uniref:hypothetical protein n=1 Tax=Streptomyces sp. NPDC049936 TaxID=3365599 RepID=UPI003798CBC7
MSSAKLNRSRPADTVEEILAKAGEALRARRRPFDEADGLRRLARKTPLPRTHDTALVTRSRRQLSVLTRLYLKDPQAARHVEELAASLGDDGDGNRHPPFEDLDIDGAQLFGCMLHLADHPQSAQFWWELAAGAGHLGATYCLYLHHTAQGARTQATHWLDQLRLQAIDLDEEFLLGAARFTQWMHEHRPPTAHPSLIDEVVRLALHHNDDQPLVCRPERQIADRLHHIGSIEQ